jgi:hypothetical protein
MKNYKVKVFYFCCAKIIILYQSQTHNSPIYLWFNADAKDVLNCTPDGGMCYYLFDIGINISGTIL